VRHQPAGEIARLHVAGGIEQRPVRRVELRGNKGDEIVEAAAGRAGSFVSCPLRFERRAVADGEESHGGRALGLMMHA
jgi:hypothetical protein